MRIRALLVVLPLVLAAGVARAQITAELILEEQYYLPGEEIPVAVKISNFSGQTIMLGNVPDWIDLSLEKSGGYLVPKVRPVRVPGEFEVESSTAATRRFDISPFFDLTQVGHFTLSATLRVSQWNQTFTTNPVKLDVLTGARIWERKFGVPPRAGEGNAPPEVRQYALIQIHRQNQIKLYATVTDASGSKIYATKPMCMMVSFSRPETELDKRSNLHVLCQNGRVSFSYNVVNPEGRLIIRQSYDNAGTGRPRLDFDRHGNVSVAGGVRIPRQDDLPRTAQPPSTLTKVDQSSTTSPEKTGDSAVRPPSP